jgi:PadR family transcriptional regulator, regulatory protein PadR
MRRGSLALAFLPLLRHTSPKGFMGRGELLQGTLDMLVLKTLTRGPMHGYAIAEFIQQSSDDILRVEEGALYPALHRLQLRGLLSGEWGVSENNRRAKYYRLTPAGRRYLAEESEGWDRLAAAVTRVMRMA